MTDLNEEDSLVQVRAQVMTRDESTEGWLPLPGGGLANVSIRKRARMQDVGGHEYIIYGQRISDQTVILSSVINRDLKYYKVMPTFVWWKCFSGKTRNGLTFQTAADSRAFDKGIVKVFSDLSRGGVQVKPSSDNQMGEDEVFMTLDLPLEPSDSKSNSEGTGSNQSFEKLPKKNQHISCELTSNNSAENNCQNTSHSKGQPIQSDNYSYVQLTAVHDYNSYTGIDDNPLAISSLCTDSTGSLKKRQGLDATDSINKDSILIRARLRCRYCQEFYQPDFNRRGDCKFAPDRMKNGIENVSGIFCARCMVYHCVEDSEDNSINHPCSCRNDENNCKKRWISLALLSIFCVPCLWCYPPLKACHWISIKCGICGAKHKPQI
ncbi:unnamed protein product [Diamesa serratosioi]